MGLAIMIAGLAIFMGIHGFAAMRGQREQLIARLGEWPYKGLFSLVSLAGVALIAYGFAGYRAAGMIDMWHPPHWTRQINNILLWPATVCVVAAYIPGRIKRILKHPMLVGAKLWAIGHLIANGDAGSIILFGSILGWAGFERVALKYRKETGDPTSFVAHSRDEDILTIVAGTLLFLALGFWFHPAIIGVPAFTR